MSYKQDTGCCCFLYRARGRAAGWVSDSVVLIGNVVLFVWPWGSWRCVENVGLGLLCEYSPFLATWVLHIRHYFLCPIVHEKSHSPCTKMRGPIVPSLSGHLNDSSEWTQPTTLPSSPLDERATDWLQIHAFSSTHQGTGSRLSSTMSVIVHSRLEKEHIIMDYIARREESKLTSCDSNMASTSSSCYGL